MNHSQTCLSIMIDQYQPVITAQSRPEWTSINHHSPLSTIFTHVQPIATITGNHYLPHFDDWKMFSNVSKPKKTHTQNQTKTYEHLLVCCSGGLGGGTVGGHPTIKRCWQAAWLNYSGVDLLRVWLNHSLVIHSWWIWHWSILIKTKTVTERSHISWLKYQWWFDWITITGGHPITYLSIIFGWTTKNGGNNSIPFHSMCMDGKTWNSKITHWLKKMFQCSILWNNTGMLILK